MTFLRAAIRAGVAVMIGVTPALALTPPLPCESSESNMTTYGLQTLDPSGASGVTVEHYYNSVVQQGEALVNAPAPVAELQGFRGVRVTLCSTGDFLVIPDQDPVSVAAALSATEFLRADVQAGRPATFDALRLAARAVYGPPLVLRETEETCGCSWYFPDLKPANMANFEDRTDVQYQ